jgi:hypothetical protein
MNAHDEQHRRGPRTIERNFVSGSDMHHVAAQLSKTSSIHLIAEGFGVAHRAVQRVPG